MSAIFETCNRVYNILEIVEKWSVIISNENCIHELPNELPNDLRRF